MDTLGLNWTSSGYSQSMKMSQTLLDDSSRISRVPGVSDTSAMANTPGAISVVFST